MEHDAVIEAVIGQLDDALDIARQSDIGFHLLDRIYGTRIAFARDPDAGLAALEDGEAAVRGPLETCPGCRITFAMPAVIAAARARELDLAARYEGAADYLANVVMRLPAWDAALELFGPERLMFGSDWPVTVPEDAHGPQGYRPTYEVLAALIGELSPVEQRAVMGDTARRVYRLR